MEDRTVEYYNENAKAYFSNTAALDMTEVYLPFLKHLRLGAKILDAGCGSGRDSLYFKNQGFQVTAFDASEEMVKLSSKLLEQEVLLMRFEDLNLSEQYDGIWACASLVHVKRDKLPSVIRNLVGYLKDGGIFYLSLKYGNKEYVEDGRYFNCMTHDSFGELIRHVPGLTIERLCTTTDVRPERQNEKWINAYLLKTESESS